MGGGGRTGGREPGRIEGGRVREAGEEMAGSGVLRGREAGEKCETLFFQVQQCVRILSKTRTQIIFDLYLTSSQSLLILPSKRTNENLRLG